MKPHRFVIILFLSAIFSLHAARLYAADSSSNRLAALPEKIAAMWYLSYPESIDIKLVRTNLKSIHSLGFNYVFLTAPVYQKDIVSTTLTMPSETYEKSLRKIIEAARAEKLGVSLTVFLLVQSGAWRGTIMPTNTKKWFSNYGDVAVKYAKLATEERVDIFAVGSEMESMKDKSDGWKSVVSRVREVFTGPVVYNTNWWYSAGSRDAVIERMPWLSDLDLLGVSGYFELTASTTPTPAQLSAAWRRDAHGQDILDDLKKLSEKTGRPVMLWEIGYRSINGANMHPWNYNKLSDSDNARDNEEQADCFRAALTGPYAQPYIKGFSIWGEDYGLPVRDMGYEVIGKAAATVLRETLLVDANKK